MQAEQFLWLQGIKFYYLFSYNIGNIGSVQSFSEWLVAFISSPLVRTLLYETTCETTYVYKMQLYVVRLCSHVQSHFSTVDSVVQERGEDQGLILRTVKSHYPHLVVLQVYCIHFRQAATRIKDCLRRQIPLALIFAAIYYTCIANQLVIIIKIM